MPRRRDSALAIAHPGIAKAATYNEWQTTGGLCMGVQGGNMAPGTPIIIWACDGSNNQFWGMTQTLARRTPFC
jgi:hypothetical protein